MTKSTNLSLQKISFIFSLVIFLQFFNGCSDDPKDIGGNLLDDGNTAQLDTLSIFAAIDSTVRVRTNGGSSRLIIGSSNGKEAVSFLRFATSSAFDTLKIDSAKITIHLNYFPDGTVQYNQSVNFLKVDSATFAKISDLRWNTFAHATYDSIFSSVPRPLPDSVLEIPVDSNVVRAKNGFFCRTANPIFGFPSLQRYLARGTKLSIYYSYRSMPDSSDSLDLLYGQSLFIANADSVANDSLIVQSGVADRVFFKFNTESFPKKLTPIIRAKYFIHLLPSSRFEMNTQPLFIQQTLSTATDSLSSLAIVCDSIAQHTYAFDIKEEMQAWVNKTQTHNGLILRSTSEGNSLDRFAIYGVNADSSLRPRVEIIYKKSP
ncbi:MAG: hypothetical protein AAB071_02180 [Bacteroidota bacterium]